MGWYRFNVYASPLKSLVLICWGLYRENKTVFLFFCIPLSSNGYKYIKPYARI